MSNKVQVRLLRRLGQNPEDTVLERSETEADWLISNGYAVTVAMPDETDLVAVAPRPPGRGRGPQGTRR